MLVIIPLRWFAGGLFSRQWAGEEASSKGEVLRENLDISRLIISLAIGAIAGAIGIISMSNFKPIDTFKAEQFFMLLGIGYAGADFIEGLKWTPKSRQQFKLYASVKR